MKLDGDKVSKKLEEWNQVTQLAIILQREGYKAGLNDLSPENRLNKLGYTREEINSNPTLKSLIS